MTRDELIEFCQDRYGSNWISLFAKDVGCNRTTVWKIAQGRTQIVSRRLELEISQIRSRPQPDAEEWRSIPGYEYDYEASSLGRIKRVTKGGVRFGGRVLAAKVNHFFNEKGYP